MPVELPELDNGPHFFYGLQWWFFGAARALRLRLPRLGRVALAAPRRAVGAREALAERKPKRAAKNAHKQAVQAAYQKAYADERAARELTGRAACRRRPGSITPDTKDAAGDSRKAATRPNSSGSP